MGSCINKSKKPVDQEKEIANSERKANNDHLYKPAEADPKKQQQINGDQNQTKERHDAGPQKLDQQKGQKSENKYKVQEEAAPSMKTLEDKINYLVGEDFSQALRSSKNNDYINNVYKDLKIEKNEQYFRITDIIYRHLQDIKSQQLNNPASEIEKINKIIDHYSNRMDQAIKVLCVNSVEKPCVSQIMLTTTTIRCYHAVKSLIDGVQKNWFGSTEILIQEIEQCKKALTEEFFFIDKYTELKAQISVQSFKFFDDLYKEAQQKLTPKQSVKMQITYFLHDLYNDVIKLVNQKQIDNLENVDVEDDNHNVHLSKNYTLELKLKQVRH